MKNIIDIIVKIAYLKGNMNKFKGSGGVLVEVNKKSKTV